MRPYQNIERQLSHEHSIIYLGPSAGLHLLLLGLYCSELPGQLAFTFEWFFYSHILLLSARSGIDWEGNS
jgi:hypothetical protein